ncbi:MAG: hypothetical protein AAF289_12460 [Cyanobacteria bacterium P01_A01_bin.135]
MASALRPELEFVPIQRMRPGTEIVVSGSRATTWAPDLMVVGEELAAGGVAV